MAVYAAYPGFAAWREARRREAGALAAEAQALEALRALPEEGIEGSCAVCDRPSRFIADTGGDPASLRESLRCMRCGANARQRAATAVLLDATASGVPSRGDGAARPPGTYLTEQAGPFYRALRRRLPGLVGSEFATTRARRWRLQAWLWRHGLFERLRFADVTALPFPDQAFDAAMSLDVLEHVPDYTAALRGFARVLRPGGRLVLTVPFYADREHSEAVARIDAAGQVEHFGTPEYHGDPLGGGVACFHHFGWDLLDALRESGFADAEALRVQDPARGLPEPLWVLRATR